MSKPKTTTWFLSFGKNSSDAKLEELIEAHQQQELADVQEPQESDRKRRRGNLLKPVSKIEERLRTWDVGYLLHFLESNKYDCEQRTLKRMANTSFQGTGEFPTFFYSSVGDFLDNPPPRKKGTPWDPAELINCIHAGIRSVVFDVKKVSENGLNYVEEFKAQVRAMH